MIIKYFAIIVFVCLLQNLSGQTSHSELVKIKRTYSDDKELLDETYFDVNGRVTKTIRFNVTMGRRYWYVLDSIVRIFEYDSLDNKTSEYGYSVKNGIRGETGLKVQYYYNDSGQIILKKHTHKAFSDEYFNYDAYGNLIKDSSDVLYVIKYEYSTDSLILRKSKYKGDLDNLVYHVINEYDSLKRLIKDYYYNYDNKLTEITTYQYDIYNNLTFQKTSHLDVYTVKRQRKDRESSFSYEYNSKGNKIKEIGIGQWKEPNVRLYEYEYY